MEEIKISGIWQIKKREFKGELHIIKNKRMIRLILQSQELREVLGDDDFPDKIDLINGISFLNKVNITLLSCRTLRKNSNFSTGITTYLIDCKYCIYGLEFKNNEKVTFNKLQVRLTNSIEWSTLNGFALKRGNKKSIENIEYTFKKKIAYNIDENIKLEVTPWFGGGSFYLNSERIILRQHVTINFVCKRLEKFENIIRELEKFIALIEFSTKQKVEIVEIKGFRNNKSYKIPEIRKRQYISYRIYFAKEVDIKNEDYEINKRDRDFTCNLRQIMEVNGLTSWFEKYEDLKPIIDSYRKNIKSIEYYDELPEEEIFINLIKALEFYHTRFVVESLQDYNKIIDRELKNALPQNEQLIRDFIYDNTQINADYVLLKSRICHLLLKDMPISYFESFTDILNFINSVVDTRHYYTHYNKSKQYKAMRGVELSITNIILQSILESYILKELGFSKNFIDKHRQNEWVRLKKYEIPKVEEEYLEEYQKVGLITSIENILRIIVKEYNLGEYFNYEIEKNEDDEDLYVKINTKTNKIYKIRILAKNKDDNCCNEIIKNDKSKLIHTKNNFYTIYYFYGKYRILIYKNK